MNGDEYVTWEEFLVVKETQQKIRAEVMGDEESGRPSLRVELMSLIQSQNEKTRRTIRVVGTTIAVGMFLGILEALTGFHIHP